MENNSTVATQNTQVSVLSQKIKGFDDTLKKYETTVAQLLGEKYNMSATEFMVSVMNAIKKTPKLLDCDPKSLFGAILLSAELGLKPNTPEGFAYIIPYGNQAQFQVGYKGLMEIAYRSPMVKGIKGVAVFENEFYQEYDNGTFKHIPYTGMDLNLQQLERARSEFMRRDLGMDGQEIEADLIKYRERLKSGKGNVVLAYAVCFLEGMEQPIWTSVTKDVLEKIKQLSKSANSSSSPYSNGTDVHNAMQFKAAIKKLFKFLPKQAQQQLAKAIEADDKIMAGGLAIMTEDGVVEIIEDVTEDERDYIEKLMNTSSYEEKAKSIIRFKMKNGMTRAEAQDVIANLKNCQVTNTHSATSAKEAVGKLL